MKQVLIALTLFLPVVAGAVISVELDDPLVKLRYVQTYQYNAEDYSSTEEIVDGVIWRNPCPQFESKDATGEISVSVFADEQDELYCIQIENSDYTKITQKDGQRDMLTPSQASDKINIWLQQLSASEDTPIQP